MNRYRSDAWSRRLRRRPRGFAYLWLLMTVVMLGFGLAGASEVYLTSVRRDKERELIFVGHQFRQAIARYRETRVAGNRQEYPASLEDLLQDRRFPDARRYLRRIHLDPMTGKAEWGLVRVAGRIVGVHSLSEQSPIKIDGFEAVDAVLRGKQKYTEWVFSHPADLIVGGAGAPIPELPASAPRLFPPPKP